MYKNLNSLSNDFTKKLLVSTIFTPKNTKNTPDFIKNTPDFIKTRETYYQDFAFVCNKLGHNADIRRQKVAYEVALKHQQHLQKEEQRRIFNIHNTKDIPFPFGLSKKISQYSLPPIDEVWGLTVNSETKIIDTKSAIGQKHRAFVMEDCQIIPTTVFESNVWLAPDFGKKGYGFRNAKEFAQHTGLIDDEHNQMVRGEAWRGTIKKLVVVLNGRKKGYHKAEKFLVCKNEFSVQALNRKQGMEAWTLNIDVAEGTDYRFVGMFLQELLYNSSLFPANLKCFLQVPINSTKEDRAYHMGVLQASALTPCIKHKEWLHLIGHVQLKRGKVYAMQGKNKEIKAVSCPLYDAASQKMLEQQLEVKDIATNRLNELYQLMMAAQIKQNELKHLQISYPKNKELEAIMAKDFKSFMNRTAPATTEDPGFLAALKACEEERAGWTEEYRAQKDAESAAAIVKSQEEEKAAKQQKRDEESSLLQEGRALLKNLSADAFVPDYSRMKKPQEYIDRMQGMYQGCYGKPYPPLDQLTKEFCIGMYGQPDIPQWILEAEKGPPEEKAS